MKHKTITIYTDGGARGNPGPGAIGAVLFGEKCEVLAEISKYIGESTNNQAEYKALINALEMAKSMEAEEIICNLDSELIVKQIKGEYKVKNEGLKPLFDELQILIKDFKKIKFEHIRREKNKYADRLVNNALDKR